MRVWVSISSKAVAENYLHDDNEKHFSNKERKKINNAMEKMNYQGKGVVSEAFSPPRIAELAGRRGMRQGTSFDYDTGWDLADVQQRKRMWQTLRAEDPDLVVISPPCGPFSLLQELNYPRMDPEKVMYILQVGIGNLEVAALVALWQVKRGRYFVYEQPHLARSWDEECISRIEKLDGVHRVRCDMCAYGLYAWTMKGTTTSQRAS